MIPEPIQANTSQREIQKSIQEGIRRKHIISPDTNKMFGLKVDRNTIYYFHKKDKRQKFLKQFNNESNYKIQKIEPK